MRRVRGQRASLPIGGDGADDQRVVAPAQNGRSDPHAVHDARAKALHHDVSLVDEAEETLPVIGRLQIERDRFLAAIERVKHRRHRFAQGKIGARIISLGPIFDLHNIRALIGKVHRRQGAGQEPGQVDDGDTVEQARVSQS